MKVTLVNHSDTRGGASVVTFRLMQALVDAGVDARMLVMHKATDSNRVAQVGPQWLRRYNFLREHLDIYAHNGMDRDLLFKVSTARWGMPLYRHPWIEDADVVALNWVNQGMLSLAGISRIKAPTVWTMHDMWCLTGICHHAGDCQRYRHTCTGCPMLHHGNPAPDYVRDLSTCIQTAKGRLYDAKPIHFVAVSTWLADLCRHSSIMADRQVSVIPNAFPLDDFSPVPTRTRARLGLPEDKRLIVMGAARLDDPIKRLPVAVDALNRLYGTDAAAVFFGDIRDASILQRLRIPYTHLGSVADTSVLSDVYAHSRVVLSTSAYETLPGTLIEGMAAGCVPVTFGRGGQRDIVDHLDTGYIARYDDIDDLEAGLRHALAAPVTPERLRSVVEQRFGAAAVADRYIDLFNSLINCKP